MRVACVFIHCLWPPAGEAPGSPSDEEQPRQLFATIAGLLEQFSPTVEIAGLDCAYLDVTGVENESALALEIAEAVSHHQATACLGVAGSKFVARAAAIAARPRAPVMVRPGEERRFVAPFPVDLLPCSEATRERLHFLGLHTMGQLARIPRDSLKTQFGPEGRLLYELPRGVDRRPLTASSKPEMITRFISFDFPVHSVAGVIPAVERVVDTIALRFKRDGRVCRVVRLRLIPESGSASGKTFHFKQPTSSPRTIMLRLRPWLDQLDPAAGIGGVEVSVEVTGDRGMQPHLWQTRRREEPDLHSLAMALERRFGRQPLKKAAPLDPDALLPENRFKLIDVA